ncbi:bifunctional copper resistance protein CopD/cytochrome c oxidase assembly protein [Nonomuraea sp. NEAU-A123]|uniref:bifunctional copper resistance protein CopD/cytochrome c oxidase assembly protein n=1 Tax=Nonomuraea sp. NEAU-A123 TaxID=2839649 RepID=UPI001BE416F8|nr:cytochrome c oxidase assembly protein [Nonomuraea sp. NEAU-A123]MBT2227651.1 cytochrome c oxidase assembly protein [Nonomuraea sp. NEAU-A123]
MSTSRGGPSTARRYAVVAVAAGVLVLVAALLFGGSLPQQSFPGLPKAGPITDWGLPLARFVYDLCAFATVGTLVAAVLLAPRGTPEAAACLRAAGRWALSWAAAAAVTYLLTISEVTGLPLADLLEDPSILTFGTTVPQTQALFIVAVAAGVVAIGTSFGPSPWLNGFLLAVAAFAVLPPAYVGHAASAGDHDIAISALMAHLVTVAVWVGGLAAVLVHFRRSDRLAEVVPRFSTLALACFAAVAVSGVASAWVRLDAVAQLWQTRYGLLILAKAAALVALGAFGWHHRRRTVAGLAERPVRHTFVRLATGEAIVMAAAVGLAVGLSRTPPPPSEGGGGHDHLLLEYDLPPFSIGNLVTEVRLDPLILLLLAVPAVGYLIGLRRLARDGVPWPPGRTAAWLAGLAVLAFALLGGVGGYARAMLSAQALQYVLVALVAPLLLALGAPLTLAAQTTTDRSQYGDVPRAILDSGLASRLTHPVTVAALQVVPVALLYGTGWLEQSSYSYAAHLLTLALLFCTGMLCFWVLTGVDPLPRPVTWVTRARLLAVVAVVPLALGLALWFGPGVGLDWFTLVSPPGVSDLSADQRAAGLTVLIIAILVLGASAVRLASWRRVAQRRRTLV